MGDKVGDKILTKSQIKVLAEIRNNNNVTKPQLEILCNLGKTSIDNAISQLKNWIILKEPVLIKMATGKY